ncbi:MULTISPECIES: 3-deoxy-D-manno-octulosonic acid transferase [unclassified Moraxella]|uniref:3-deoxy-D-manno-octulosonic acid transferase n=1 Tax=unclassified Moraxella TaxID=2685852 RepID=UPI003AF5E788
MSATPFYYRLAITLLKPLYQLKLATKKTLPNEVNERFGKNYPTLNTNRPIIWCHAVSLGETNTAEPILRGLLAEGYALWLTNTTHTGFARVEELFANDIANGMVYHSFVPVDDGKIIDKFLDHVQPIGALFVETELWATTLAKLEQRQIASILVNGRLSEKSFNGYAKASKLSQSMMENLSLIIAQDGDSAKRFRQLGATSDKIRMASSLKWSSKANPLMIQRANSLSKEWQLENRTVILGASTHADEESQLLQVFEQLKTKFTDKNLLLIIVPRHPERFNEVAELLQKQGMTVVRRSQQQQPSMTDSVYLADSMGELGVWYTLANMAIVGGSLVNIGGHNPIESAIVGTPVVMGQHTQSCQQVVDSLKQVGALQQVNDKEALATVLGEWIANPTQAKQAGQAGQTLAEQYQDATKQQLAMIIDVLGDNEKMRIDQQVRLIDNEFPTQNGKILIDDLGDV